MNSPRFGSALESLVVSAGRSPVIAVLSVGLIIALLNSGSRTLDLPWREHALLISALALATLLGWEILWRVVSRPVPLPVAPFLLATIVGGAVLRFCYVTLIQPEWYTDFERYWRYGVTLAVADSSEIHNVYSQRANFLTRPLIEAFGPRRALIPYSNILVLTLIQVLGYDILRRVRSHQAAQGFSMLWLAAPIPLMTAAVPNHDLFGLLLLAIALWLGTLAHYRNEGILFGKAEVACWIGAGAAIAVLEAVRGLGTLYLISLGLLTFATLVVIWIQGAHRDAITRRLAIRGALGLVIVAIASWATEGALRKAGALMPSESERHAMIRYTTPHATSLSDGSYSFMRAFEQTFMVEFNDEPERYSSFRRSLALTDFTADPRRRIQASLSRMQRQYLLGGEQAFYTRGIQGRKWVVLTAYNVFFGAVFAALLLLSIYRLAQRRARVPLVEAFLLLLTATISAVLLLVGENQPRYLSLLWLTGAIVIPSQIPREARNANRPLTPSWLLASSVGILLILLATFWLTAAFLLTPARGLILHDWEYSSDLDAAHIDPRFFRHLQKYESTVLSVQNGKFRPVTFGKLSTKLMLPAPPSQASMASTTTTVCGLKAPAGFEFHYDAPAKHLAGRNAFSLELHVNGRRTWHSALPNPAQPPRVRTLIPVDESGCAHLRFDLRAHVDANRKSWQDASLVEIFFPRIVAAPSTPGE